VTAQKTLPSRNRTTSPFTTGLDAVLFVLGGKWKPLIVFHLWERPRRYGDLRRAVGRVSDKVLAQQLKELQADGIIDRVDYGEIPPKVEYSLTPFGASLMQALHVLCQLGADHADALAAIVARRVPAITAQDGAAQECAGHQRAAQESLAQRLSPSSLPQAGGG